MAGNWIKFDTSTPDKPEVWAIADSLGIDPDAVVGKLLRVWTWFDDHSEKGNAPSVTKALLDRRVGVTGFVSAMVNAGWMLEVDGVLSLPNFDRHNGETAKTRALTAKRVANHKKSNAEGNAKSNGESVSEALPREEKNREEKIKEKNTPKRKAAVERPTDVDEQTWSDWLLVRQSKKAGWATHTSVNMLRKEAAKAGLTIQQAVEMAAGSSWIMFKAEYLKGDGTKTPPKPLRKFGDPA